MNVSLDRLAVELCRPTQITSLEKLIYWPWPYILHLNDFEQNKQKITINNYETHKLNAAFSVNLQKVLFRFLLWPGNSVLIKVFL